MIFNYRKPVWNAHTCKDVVFDADFEMNNHLMNEQSYIEKSSSVSLAL